MDEKSFPLCSLPQRNLSKLRKITRAKFEYLWSVQLSTYTLYSEPMCGSHDEIRAISIHPQSHTFIYPLPYTDANHPLTSSSSLRIMTSHISCNRTHPPHCTSPKSWRVRKRGGCIVALMTSEEEGWMHCGVDDE